MDVRGRPWTSTPGAARASLRGRGPRVVSLQTRKWIASGTVTVKDAEGNPREVTEYRVC